MIPDRTDRLLLPFPGVAALRHRSLKLAGVLLGLSAGLALFVIIAPNAKLRLIGFVAFLVYAAAAHVLTCAMVRNTAGPGPDSPRLVALNATLLTGTIAIQVMGYAACLAGLTDVVPLWRSNAIPTLCFLDNRLGVESALRHVREFSPRSQQRLLHAVLERGPAGMETPLFSALLAVHSKQGTRMPPSLRRALAERIHACGSSRDACVAASRSLLADKDLAVRATLLDQARAQRDFDPAHAFDPKALARVAANEGEHPVVRVLSTLSLARFTASLDATMRKAVAAVAGRVSADAMQGKVLAVSFGPAGGAAAIDSLEAFSALCQIGAFHADSLRALDAFRARLTPTRLRDLYERCLSAIDQSAWNAFVASREAAPELRVRAWRRLREQWTGLSREERRGMLGAAERLTANVRELQSLLADKDLARDTARMAGSLCQITERRARLEPIVVTAIRAAPAEYGALIGEECESHNAETFENWETALAWASLRAIEDLVIQVRAQKSAIALPPEDTIMTQVERAATLGSIGDAPVALATLLDFHQEFPRFRSHIPPALTRLIDTPGAMEALIGKGSLACREASACAAFRDVLTRIPAAAAVEAAISIGWSPEEWLPGFTERLAVRNALQEYATHEIPPETRARVETALEFLQNEKGQSRAEIPDKKTF